MMTRRTYIAIRILLFVACYLGDYNMKPEIENLTREIRKLMEEELAEEKENGKDKSIRAV